MAYGATKASLSLKQVRDLEIPVPPLDVQRRIVAKLDALLAQSRAARKQLEAVPALVEKYRQSVLAAASSGQLTAEWRLAHPDLSAAPFADQHGQEGEKRRGRLWGAGNVPDLTEAERHSIPSSWSWQKVADLGADAESAVQIGPMSMKSSDFSSTGVTVLNVGCVKPGRVDTRKCDFLPPDKASEFRRYAIQENDVLFTRSGTVGRCAVAGAEHVGAVMTFHLLRVRPDQQRCLSQYLWAVFQGAPSIRRQMKEAQVGSTRAGFNTRLLASLDVPVPPLAEQFEIVRRLEGLLRGASEREQTVSEVEAAFMGLERSLLAKAFRGELTT